MRSRGLSGYEGMRPAYVAAGGWAARPRYGLDDVAALLWRDRLLILTVFAVLFVIGAGLALMLPKTYTARSDILVQLAQEYVYEPRAGDAARGAIPEINGVVEAETAILGSGELHRRVVRTLGPGAILHGPARGTEAQREAAAVKALGGGLDIATAPDTGLVQLSFKHRDPEAAATILNQVIATYLDYRREVFRDTTSPLLQNQREAIVRQLDSADAAYEAFLAQNGLGDYATERTAVTGAYQTVFGERLAVEGQLRQAEGRLAALNAQLAATPAEIALQQDLNLSAQDSILELRTERENLLSRYQPDAPPVREIDQRIAQLQAYVAGGTAVGVRDMRTGPNPVWQELETERVRAAAERDALAARLAVLNGQVGRLERRMAELTELESRNGALAAEREVLSGAYRDFTARQAQADAAAELAREGADSVRVISRATPPTQGSSLKKAALVLALLFAGFTALCAGLLRMFLGRRFVTAGSASRTLDLPVLAVAPAKAR